MKRKRPKRQYTPEQLARLRASMARAREARVKRKRVGIQPEPNLGGDVECVGQRQSGGNTPLIASALNASEPAPTVQSAGAGTLEMTIDQLPQNERIVLARHPDYNGQQTVFVGHHENFIVGMKVPVVRHPSQPGFWTLARELPRFKGRW